MRWEREREREKCGSPVSEKCLLLLMMKRRWVPLRADGGWGWGVVGVEKDFWSPSNIHTVIQMSAIPNLLEATLDLSRTQQYNENSRPKRVHPNEDQTGK